MDDILDRFERAAMAYQRLDKLTKDDEKNSQYETRYYCRNSKRS